MQDIIIQDNFISNDITRIVTPLDRAVALIDLVVLWPALATQSQTAQR